MIILGLTGSIASGKSTVLAMCAKLGAATFDADKAVHRLLAQDSEVATLIAKAFPELPSVMPVDRKALGALVFNSPARLAELEAILHPRVRQMESLCLRKARHEGRRIAVCDIPLLFETGDQKRFDAVISVIAPQEMQQQRALARAGMTPERYQRILARQTPNHLKRIHSDFVIHSGLGKAVSMRELKTIFAKLQVL